MSAQHGNYDHDGYPARCWALTEAGELAVNPPRLVPSSSWTRRVIDRLLAEHECER